jgi:hypothetical protein
MFFPSLKPLHVTDQARSESLCLRAGGYLISSLSEACGGGGRETKLRSREYLNTRTLTGSVCDKPMEE